VRRLLGVIDRFWFAEAPAARLAVLRILIGTFAFYLVGSHYQKWTKIGHTSPLLFQPVGVVAILDQPLPAVVCQGLIIAALVANVAFILGWRYRFTGPLFAALLWWISSYRNSWSMIYHSANLVVLHVLILALAPAADALSLDSRRHSSGRDAADGWQYGWSTRLICTVTVLSYLVTGVAKVAGPLGMSWATGEALRSQVAADALRKEVLGDAGSPLFYVLYDSVWLFTILAVVTLVLELGAPAGLLNKRLAQRWALSAFLMHWGVYFIMGIKFRYQLSGILFASFFDVERLVAWLRALRSWGEARLHPVGGWRLPGVQSGPFKP
jgi:hypothetical protein